MLNDDGDDDPQNFIGNPSNCKLIKVKIKDFILSIGQEKNQNYDNLKMSLNNNKSNILNLNEKVEKKFFEIIRDNTIGDVSKSITTLTMSQSDSCDGSSDREEKSFLNKKRKGIFDVVSSPEEKKEIK